MDNIVTVQRIEETRNWIKDKISQTVKHLSHSKIEEYVGSSGTIMNIGLMLRERRGFSKSDSPILNNFEFSADELFEIEAEVLSRKTLEERKAIPGLEEGRADIIPAGIIIISTIFRMLKIQKMIISGYALREGIVLDSMDKLGIS